MTFLKKKRICPDCGSEMIEMFTDWICEACDERGRQENREAYCGHDKGPPPSSEQDHFTCGSGYFYPIMNGGNCSGTIPRPQNQRTY